MLSWALTFLIIGLTAGVLGLTGIAGAATQIAWVLFVVFMILFLTRIPQLQSRFGQSLGEPEVARTPKREVSKSFSQPGNPSPLLRDCNPLHRPWRFYLEARNYCLRHERVARGASK